MITPSSLITLITLINLPYHQVRVTLRLMALANNPDSPNSPNNPDDDDDAKRGIGDESHDLFAEFRQG